MGNANKWSDDDLAYIKMHYGNDGPESVAKALGRTKTAVTRKAAKLKITAYTCGDRKYWSSEEVEYLKENYNKIPTKEIAIKLKRSQESVKHKAATMYLREKAKTAHRPWTEKEIRYMERNYERQPAAVTAKWLKRTIYSVRRKAETLKMNAYVTDQYSASMIAKCLDVNVKVVLRWINKYGLKATKIIYPTQVRYLIDADDFWAWAELNKPLVNWANYTLLTILPEPDWAEKERANSHTKRHHMPVTLNEKNEIRGMLRKGLSYEDISKKVRRTRYGVAHIGKSVWYD